MEIKRFKIKAYTENGNFWGYIKKSYPKFINENVTVEVTEYIQQARIFKYKHNADDIIGRLLEKISGYSYEIIEV